MVILPCYGFWVDLRVLEGIQATHTTIVKHGKCLIILYLPLDSIGYGKFWRRGGDSNSRSPYRLTRFRGERNRPLCHLSASLHLTIIRHHCVCRMALWKSMPCEYRICTRIVLCPG